MDFRLTRTRIAVFAAVALLSGVLAWAALRDAALRLSAPPARQAPEVVSSGLAAGPRPGDLRDLAVYAEGGALPGADQSVADQASPQPIRVHSAPASPAPGTTVVVTPEPGLPGFHFGRHPHRPASDTPAPQPSSRPCLVPTCP